MGIRVEFNPDLALREIPKPTGERKKILPKTLTKLRPWNYDTFQNPRGKISNSVI